MPDSSDHHSGRGVPIPGSEDGADAGEEDGNGRRGVGVGLPSGRRLSEVLAALAVDRSRDHLSVNDLLHLLEGRARAALILIFAFPNVLPTPPGTSGILGLPLLYLTAQMTLGRIPWLPNFIGERAMPIDSFAKLTDRLLPFLARTERLLRPRWSLVVSHRAEHVLGALCFILAVVLALPIPLGNVLPALAICLIALGVLERDGLWVCLGIVVAIIALAITLGVVYAIFKAGLFIVLNAFS